VRLFLISAGAYLGLTFTLPRQIFELSMIFVENRCTLFRFML
jgi:hypothetical protein